jgi:DNA (cytosine-5)-methyltransferase 1
VPALVAITQTTVLGKQKRRLTVREAARLQGLPEWFDFLDQTSSQTFKQLGNGVNIGVVYNVMKALVLRDLDLLGSDSTLVKSILNSPNSPDEYLRTFHAHQKSESAGSARAKLREVNSSPSA